MSATVKHGRGYQGLDGFTVENPDAQRFIPGHTVGIAPAHEEAPAWRAILAGYDAEGSAYVVPLQGHFGELRVRKVRASGISMFLAKDAPHHGGANADECDWIAAKVLALSAAMAFGLEGRA